MSICYGKVGYFIGSSIVCSVSTRFHRNLCQDLTEGEEVRLLECGHCFHTGCIVPWLELHGTCPVCRKQLGSPAPGPGIIKTRLRPLLASSSQPRSRSLRFGQPVTVTGENNE